MSELLPPVVAVLKAEIGEFTKKMHEAKSEMGKVESEGKSHFSALSVAAVAGVTAVAGGLFEVGKHSLDAFKEQAGAVARLQRLSGESAESMSHLSFAAEETGVSSEKLEGALKKMSKTVSANSKAFQEHGIATRDAQGNMLPMSEVIANASELFKSMPDGIEKNTLAMQLFGKQGTDLIPLLNQGKEGLAKFGEEADKFGITIGQGGVDSYKKNVKNSREMHAALKGLEIQIGAKLMPIVTKLTTWLAENLPPAIEFVRKVIEKLTPAFEAVGAGIAWLVEWFQAHWDQISATISTVVGYITGLFNTGVAIWEGIWDVFGGAIITLLSGAWEFVKSYLQAAFEIITGFFDFFRDLFTGKWGKLWGDVMDILTGFWDAIKAYIQLALDTIRAILEGAWSAVKTLVTNAWGGIKSAVSTGVDGVIGFVAGLPARALSALSSLGSSLLSLGGKAIGALWDGISGGWDVGWSFITGLPDKVIGGLASWGDKLFDLGKKVIGSLWDGIKAAWNTMADAATFTLPKFHIWGIGDVGGGTVTLLPHLHSGGVVPGALGQEVPVVLQAGETVRTTAQESAVQRQLVDVGRDRRALPPVTVNNYGIFDPHQVAHQTSRAVGWELRRV